MPIDVDAARDDTPGCGNRIHFNNAGASLMPRPVIDVIISHLELEGRIGGYEAAEAETEAVEHSDPKADAKIAASAAAVSPVLEEVGRRKGDEP